MEKTRNKPKELLPYGMLLTKLFKHVVSIFPELAINHYLSYDQVMHPLTPYYQLRTCSNHGKKRSRDSNASFSSTTLNHLSPFHPLDDIVDDNDEESFRSNYSSPSKNVSSSSNVVSRVLQNLPHERNMMNEVDIENLTIEQYLMLTQEKQTHGMIRTESEVSSDEDVDEWLNEELSKRMTGEDKEEEKDVLIDILKTVVEECKSVYKKAQIKTPSSGTSKIKGYPSIGNLKIYVMADVGAGINMMPKSLFEHLKLANLKKTSMAIEIVIDTLEIILLGRPFLATIHAQIDVFRGEILLGVGNEKSEYVNPHEIEIDNSPALGQRTFHYSEESVYTVDSSSDSQENEVGSHLSEIVSRWHVCKPVHITYKVYEEDCGIWPTCNPDLSFCSGYRNKNIDDVTRERRYYECVAHNYDFKVKSQRTTKYTDPYNLHHYFDSPPNDTLRLNTYFTDVSQTQPKSRIRENSFEEWMKIKLWHTYISDSMRCVMFKEWVKEDYNFGVNIGRTKDDPYSRNFNVYKDEFDKEIKQLVNEYELKVGRKRYALKEVWEKCEKFHDSTKQWYGEGFKEGELWQNGIEETDYTPPLAKNETFEIHHYTLKMGKVS
ncbi:hypothetical protein Tco_1254119 [Tanacetum coccineum]